MSKRLKEELEFNDNRFEIINKITEDDLLIYERYITCSESINKIADCLSITIHRIQTSIDTVKKAVLKKDIDKLKRSDENLVFFRLYSLRILTRFSDSPFSADKKLKS